LHAAGVGGTTADREEVSRRFEGHPLALRVFAQTLEEQANGDPTRLVERVFDAAHADETGTLEGKISRLLLFYEQRLPQDRVALLGLVSLFRAPVAEATIVTLARGLPAVADALGSRTDAALRQTLETMAHEHLLIRDPAKDGSSVWSCHPVLRDHFRGALLGWGKGIAASAAGLLTGEPSEESVTSVEQLQPVLTAIELLLDGGIFRARTGCIGSVWRVGTSSSGCRRRPRDSAAPWGLSVTAEEGRRASGCWGSRVSDTC
jgi:hypothetical protein